MYKININQSFLTPPYADIIANIFFVYLFLTISLFLFNFCYFTTTIPCFCLNISSFILWLRYSIYFLHLCFTSSSFQRIIYLYISSSYSPIFFSKFSHISSSLLFFANLLSRATILLHNYFVYFYSYYLLLYFYGDRLEDLPNFLSNFTLEDWSFLIGL